MISVVLSPHLLSQLLHSKPIYDKKTQCTALVLYQEEEKDWVEIRQPGQKRVIKGCS